MATRNPKYGWELGGDAAQSRRPVRRLFRHALAGDDGRVIGGRYIVTHPLGAGGMGTVYAAIDALNGDEVAVKALPPGRLDPDQTTRLRREAEIACKVESSFVCRVHHLAVDRGELCIVMERLRGETLRTRLEREGALSIADAVRLTLQLLRALTATHAAGIVHRDVKPGNVFIVSPPGEPIAIKLFDFGVAEEPDRDESEPLNGTLRYVAPEQLLGGRIDHRADVFAAAVVLFTSLTGEHPFGRPTWKETLEAIFLDPPASAAALRMDIPEAFDDLFAIAFAKEPDRRFATAMAFERALVSVWRDERLRRRGNDSAPVPRLSDDSDDSATGESSVALPLVRARR